MDNQDSSANGDTTQGQPAITLTERGVVFEGQRIASVMSDGARSLLARPPLILLPDAGAVWTDYRAIMERFSASRRVFALDWPGYGGSAHPTPAEFTYTLERFTTLFGQWVDSLGIARAVVLGHGLAAGVAVRHAVAKPGRTLGLALVGPLGFAGQNAIEAFTGRALRSAALWRLVEPMVTSLGLGPTTDQTRLIETDRALARKDPEYAASLAATVALWRDAEAVRDVTTTQAQQTNAPSLVIRGALDPICTEAEARLTAEALGERGGLHITLPEAGHLPHLQQPDRFYQALDGLLLTAEANMAAAN